MEKEIVTDIEKIAAVLESFGFEIVSKEKSIVAGPRRYYFDEQGRIEKIITYHMGNKSSVAIAEGEVHVDSK
jgi:hypothetical protein